MDEKNVEELNTCLDSIVKIMRYESELKFRKLFNILPKYDIFDPRLGVFTPEEIEYFNLYGIVNESCIDKNTGRCVSNRYIHDHMFNFDPYIQTIRDLSHIAISNKDTKFTIGSIPDEGFYYCTFPCRKVDLIEVIKDKVNKR